MNSAGGSGIPMETEVMKRTMLCGMVLLVTVHSSMAQERSPMLLAGYTHTLTPYLEDGVLDGFHLGFYRPLAENWSLHLRSGLHTGRYTTKGRTYGGAGEVLLWDNSYAFSQRERLTHLDLIINRELISPESRFGLRVGAGAGLIHHYYRYPEEVLLFQGEILSRSDRTDQAWKPSLLFSLAGDIRVIGPWHAQGGIAWRPTLREVTPFSQRATHSFGQGIVSVTERELSGRAEWFTHFHLGLGYRF